MWITPVSGRQSELAQPPKLLTRAECWRQLIRGSKNRGPGSVPSSHLPPKAAPWQRGGSSGSLAWKARNVTQSQQRGLVKGLWCFYFIKMLVQIQDPKHLLKHGQDTCPVLPALFFAKKVYPWLVSQRNPWPQSIDEPQFYLFSSLASCLLTMSKFYLTQFWHGRNLKWHPKFQIQQRAGSLLNSIL